LSVQLAGDGVLTATVLLLQGSQVIASQLITPRASPEIYTLSGPTGAGGLISNYADLHVQVVANTPGQP
jgi:hypothetical protein